MGERDARYLLSGYIEVDDAFFGAPTSNGKRGRGTDKSVVLGGLSLNEKGHPQYTKMQVVPNVQSETVSAFAGETIEQGAVVSSDEYSSYKILAEKGYVHEGKICDPVKGPEHLRWLHTIISNAKSYIMGTYHELSELHLQRYLDEFCYRFNRRKFTSQHFDRTLFACSLAPRLTYHELTRYVRYNNYWRDNTGFVILKVRIGLLSWISI